MRIYIFLVLLGAGCIPACAGSLNTKLADEQALASLEQRAAQAPAKTQCYMYAQLVHEMINFSAGQYAAGNAEVAAGMLKRSQEITRRIRTRMAENTRKLKETQILLRRSAYRLTDLLHAGSSGDGSLVEQTLAQLNQTQDALMLQVFKK